MPDQTLCSRVDSEYCLVLGGCDQSDILDFTELEFGASGLDSWRWMYDDYNGYLINLQNGGLLTQEDGTVILAQQLGDTEADPTQQWTLDYNGQTAALSECSQQPPSLSLFFSE